MWPTKARTPSRLDLLPSFVPQDADEPAHCVRLPLGDRHDLGQARFIIAMTSAFLLLRSTAGLPAVFLVRAGFFADLAFLAGVRLPLVFVTFGSSLPLLSESITL